MPYTLTKGLLWFALALLLGVVIGWLLRSIRATRQLRAARVTQHDSAELARLRARLANLEPAVSENDRLKAELADVRTPATPAASAAVSEPEATTEPEVEPADPEPEPQPEPEPEPEPAPLETEPAEPEQPPAPVGGPDDLTAIEGVGPAIAGLINGIGIHTWAELADTEVSLLRTMLTDAGPQFSMHQPDSWPEQGALLAAGRLDEFRELTERLRGGTE